MCFPFIFSQIERYCFGDKVKISFYDPYFENMSGCGRILKAKNIIVVELIGCCIC